MSGHQQITVPQRDAPDEGAVMAAMFTDLRAWAAEQNPAGHVWWAADASEVPLILLGGRSERWRGIMSFDTDEPADDRVAPLVLDYRLNIIVESGEGLRPDRSVLGLTGETYRSSLLAIASAVRFRVLAWRLDEAQVYKGKLFYTGKRAWEPPSGDVMAAYQLGFRWTAAAPSPLEADVVNLLSGETEIETENETETINEGAQDG